MAIAYRIKERLRDFYATFDPDEARQLLVELQGHYLRRAMPPEVQSSVGRSACGSTSSAPTTWPGWVPNGPTEATNDLIKRIKRIGFGFCNFENYRIPRCSTPPNELACPGLDRRPVRGATPQNPKSRTSTEHVSGITPNTRVRPSGFEPETCGLRVRCSAVELEAHRRV